MFAYSIFLNILQAPSSVHYYFVKCMVNEHVFVNLKSLRKKSPALTSFDTWG